MSATVTYKPEDLDARKLHGCLLGGIAPRPIAFVSTVDGHVAHAGGLEAMPGRSGSTADSGVCAINVIGQIGKG